MKTVSFYHKDTGILGGHLTTTDGDDVIIRNTPDNHLAVDGHHDPLSSRVDIQSGAVVDYQPPQPSAAHDWNDVTKRWQLCPSAQATIDRRAAALAGITQHEASQHRAIREALLNMPGATARLAEIDSKIAALRADL